MLVDIAGFPARARVREAPCSHKVGAAAVAHSSRGLARCSSGIANTCEVLSRRAPG